MFVTLKVCTLHMYNHSLHATTSLFCFELLILPACASYRRVWIQLTKYPNGMHVAFFFLAWGTIANVDISSRF